MAEAFIGLGSNIGNCKTNIEEAVRRLSATPEIKVVKTSSLYLTEPVGRVGQDWFINSAVKISTQLPPKDLLYLCQGIEERMGRVRTMPWGPRIIDLDILLYDLEIFEDDELIIPHPHMHKRKFVLVPLAEIAADAVHPKLNKTVSELLHQIMVKDTQKVELYRQT